MCELEYTEALKMTKGQAKAELDLRAVAALRTLLTSFRTNLERFFCSFTCIISPNIVLTSGNH